MFFSVVLTGTTNRSIVVEHRIIDAVEVSSGRLFDCQPAAWYANAVYGQSSLILFLMGLTVVALVATFTVNFTDFLGKR